MRLCVYFGNVPEQVRIDDRIRELPEEALVSSLALELFLMDLALKIANNEHTRYSKIILQSETARLYLRVLVKRGILRPGSVEFYAYFEDGSDYSWCEIIENGVVNWDPEDIGADRTVALLSELGYEVRRRSG